MVWKCYSFNFLMGLRVKVELEKTMLIIVDFMNYKIFNIKITYQSYLRKYQLHRKHTLNVEYSTKLEFIYYLSNQGIYIKIYRRRERKIILKCITRWIEG